MKNEWQPIETAPKKYGVPLLLVVGFETKRVVMGELNIDSGSPNLADYWWIYDVFSGRKATKEYTGLPTHWMPLPDLP